MPTFLIEREIPGASTLTREELAEITAKSNDVVAGLDVPYRWITSYVAGDKIYCVHETENVETIREHAQSGGFPADLVVEVSEQINPDFK
jgi:selenophosphate synthetase-related protein